MQDASEDSEESKDEPEEDAEEEEEEEEEEEMVDPKEKLEEGESIYFFGIWTNLVQLEALQATVGPIEKWNVVYSFGSQHSPALDATAFVQSSFNILRCEAKYRSHLGLLSMWHWSRQNAGQGSREDIFKLCYQPSGRSI